MEQQTRKQTEEALAEIYRNAQLAIQSIVDITPLVEDEQVKKHYKSLHGTR